MSFCVTFGTLIKLSTQSEVPIENVKIDDSVLGFDQNSQLTQFTISEIIHASGESIYKFYFIDGEICCSESHCLSDAVTGLFKHAFEIGVGDSIKGIEKDHKIIKIEILPSEPVIGLVLNNNGCYFANGLLSHSQDTHPSFVTSRLKSSDEPVINSALKTLDDQSASIALDTQINVSDTETTKAEDLSVGDMIYSASENNVYKKYTISEKKLINNQTVYAIYCNDFYLECSENYNILSFTDNSFVFPWQISKGDFIKTTTGISAVEKVIAKGVKPTVSIKLSDKGTLIANGIISHGNAQQPDYDIKTPSKNTVFKPLFASSNTQDFMSPGVHGKGSVEGQNGAIKCEKISKGDKIYGFNDLLGKELYEVIDVNQVTSDCVEIKFTDGSTVTVSEGCPVFSQTRQNFVHAYGLKQDESIKFESEVKKIQNIVYKGNQKVYSIQISKNGCFFVDGVLIHNQKDLPALASKMLKDKKSSSIDIAEINKIIKPEVKEILPLWKYDSHKDWKKAFYLLDFNLFDEEAGYSFGLSGLNVKMAFDVNSHSDEVIMVKIIGKNPEINLNFNNIAIKNEIDTFVFDETVFYFVKLNMLSSSLPESIFEFKFKSSSDCLLTNLNLIKSEQHHSIVEYFQG